jgi:hypothetical protein
VTRAEDPRLIRLRASIALRSRYAEDALGEAVARGVRQYVLLGAGLDTFAYRNPYAGEGLRVFEVDHPATQQWKRDRLRQVGIPLPDSPTFVAIDFERETIDAALARAGFDRRQPAFLSWLGVTVTEPRCRWQRCAVAGPARRQRDPSPHRRLLAGAGGAGGKPGESWKSCFDPVGDGGGARSASATSTT